MTFEVRPVEYSTIPFIAELFAKDAKAGTSEASHLQHTHKVYEPVIQDADAKKDQALLRVYDTASGRDAAWAHWVFPQGPKSPLNYSPGLNMMSADQQLIQTVKEAYDRTRQEILGGRQCYTLHSLYAHPDFMGLGAGSTLIRWPFEEADRKELPCLLSTAAQSAATHLYETHGFTLAGGYEIDLSKYGGSGIHKQVLMIREPNTANVLNAGIIIISDTASQDPSTDKTGAVLKEVFETEGGGLWKVGATAIVADDVEQIQRKVQGWCGGKAGAKASAFNLILTTGGTGFAVKDVTPEAIEPLLERKAPGLVHAMLSSSLQVTPFAAMSRPVAGTRGKTLIISVPGSPKGAKENLQAILKLLPHACQQSAGAHSRSLHAGGVKKLEKDAGISSNALSSTAAKGHAHHNHNHGHDHSHGHGHGHHHGPAGPHTRPEDRPQANDPSAGPTARYRESPYPKLAVADAIERILAQTPAPNVIDKAVNRDLVGSILAEDVTAAHPVPAFRASIVDGYAVITAPKSTNQKGTFEVAGISHAAPGQISDLEEGKIARITTGAPLPPNATAVVMVEDTVLCKMTADGKEEAEVEILTDQVKDGENVREVGSDIAQGDTILQKGDRISAVGGELGVLASVGRATVKVYKKPVIGVMSTGNEIVPHDRQGELQLGEVRDTNRITLMSAISGWGYEVEDLGIAKDAPGDLEATLRAALRQVDAIVTTGGVSMGELDLLKPTIERSLGGTIHFGRVAMKPGMPTTFATVPFKSVNGDPRTALIFSLPGNPASGMVTASLFMRPCIDLWSGVDKSRIGQPKAKVVLAADTKSDARREEYQRAVVWQGDDGRLYGQTTGFQRSSRIGSFNKANALLIVAPGQGVLEKGRMLDALLLGSLAA